MTNYRAEQDISISGWECGTEIDLKIVATYGMTKYYPASNDGPAEYPQPENVNIRFFRKHDKVNVEVLMPAWVEDDLLDSDEFKTWLTGEATEQALIAAEDAADQKREMTRAEGTA